MGELIDLKKEREEREPYMVGQAQCLACKHIWEARVQVGVYILECPECGLEKATMRGLVQPGEGESRWVCYCECDLFYIPSDCNIPTCVMCGTVQEGYLDA